MENISGVIMCGGKSKRMGTDKGMLKFNGNSWAKNACDKVSSIFTKLFLSVNVSQYTLYQTEFSDGQLIPDNDHLQIGGPLAGILSVHIQYPQDDLFVLACDMVLMEPFIIDKLLMVYRENPVAEAYVFLNDGEPEPLCAIYTAKALSFISDLLNSKELGRHSMKFILDQVHTCTIPVPDEQKKYFRNFNSPDELEWL